MILCARCQTQPPQLQGGWYSEDNGQWVSCMLCDRLKDIAAMEPDSLAGFVPNPFKKDGPFMHAPLLPAITAEPYVSLDLETTGLDHSWCQILEIGAIWDNWTSPISELKRFHCYVVHDRYQGEPFALAMNVEILRRIANKDKPENAAFKFYSPEEAMRSLWMFVRSQVTWDTKNPPKIVMAGKNYASFDDRFLEKLPGYNDVKQFHRRIDPGMLYWNPRTDVKPPDTKTCLQRAGIDTEVQHDAIADATDVIRLIRRSFNVRE